jgi:chitin-binding protein
MLTATLVFRLAQASDLSHGSMQSPISRVYNCFLEGPESPDSAACQAAVAMGGTQPLYDWNEINLANANGNHQALIPDGKLCSAGRSKFAGFDQARLDWVATTLPISGSYTFSFRASAPHRGTMYLYLTKNGYNPSQPLKWSDLEATPFSTYTTAYNTVNGAYSWTAQLPTGKSGRHLIYMIWQRSDSPEAFYACSDVVFGSSPATNTPGASTATPIRTTTPAVTLTSTRTNTPAIPPTQTNTPGSVPAWAPWTAYNTGQLVTYNGGVYKCLQAHTSQPGWEPANVPALWTLQ